MSIRRLLACLVAPAIVVLASPAASAQEPAKAFDVKWNLKRVPGVFQSPIPLIFPLKLEFASRGVSLAAIRSPIVWLVEHPKYPLNLTWSFVLDEPILFSPDGVFRSLALEKLLSSGGR